MKIVLVITNSKKKNLVFVSNELAAYSLEQAVQATREGKIEGVHIVHRGKNVYIRTNPEPSDRGTQIMEEFYPLAKDWLI